MSQVGPGFDELNIFFVHLNPTIAAQMLCDSHVRKMVLECTQMCANAYWMTEATMPPPKKKDGTPYKLSHPNHPCSKWVMEDLKQWIWVNMHGIALAHEFKYRFDKDDDHGCLEPLMWMNKNLPRWLTHKQFWDPPMSMEQQYMKRASGTIASYRNYYRNGKRHLHKWTKRLPPLWLIDFLPAKQIVAAIIDAATIEMVDPDKHRPEGIADDQWEITKRVATQSLNGEDVDTDHWVDDLINAVEVCVLDIDKHRPGNLNDAEWQVISKIANEQMNGRDPLENGVEWDYNKVNA